MKLLKKSLLVLVFGLILFYSPAFAASDQYPENYKLNSITSDMTNGFSNYLTLTVGETVCIPIAFTPEDCKKELIESPDNAELRWYDPSIADIRIIDDKYVQIIAKSSGKVEWSFHYRVSSNLNWFTHINVEVVSDSVNSITCSISSLNKSTEVINRSYPVDINVDPVKLQDFIKFRSEDPEIASVSPANYKSEDGGIRFWIGIKGKGSTKIVFSLGDKVLEIPVTVEEPNDSNLVDPKYLPISMTKEDVRNAYMHYIYPHNMPNDVFDYVKEKTVGSDTYTPTLDGIKVVQDFTNFYRALAGVGEVTYTDEANRIAQIGVNYCDKYKTIAHEAADAEQENPDPQVSPILHSSNLAFGGRINKTCEFINDYYNDSINGGKRGVGHRIWMLRSDFKVMGFANKGYYNCQYYDKNDVNPESDLPIAVPSKGFFPIEAFERESVTWSFSMGPHYLCDELEKTKITVTEAGKGSIELKYNDVNSKDGYFIYNSNMRTLELQPVKFIGRKNADNKSNKNLNGRTFTIKIEGLLTKDENSGIYERCKPIEYTTTFISIIDNKWNPQMSYELYDKTSGKKIDNSFTMNVGETKLIELRTNPSEYQNGFILYHGSKNIDIERDENQFLITALAPGTISLKVSSWDYKPFEAETPTYILKITGSENNSGSFPETNPGANGGPIGGAGGSEGTSGEEQPNGKPGFGPSTNTGNNNDKTDDETNSKPDGSENQIKAVPVYRLYNRITGEHLYTTDNNEVNVLTKGDWNDEGIGWNSPSSGSPVWRLYSPITCVHLFTTDRNEVDTLASRGWSIDNSGLPLFYSGGNTQIYRLYNPILRMHLITKDINEYNVLPAEGWQQEGAKLNAL